MSRSAQLLDANDATSTRRCTRARPICLPDGATVPSPPTTAPPATTAPPTTAKPADHRCPDDRRTDDASSPSSRTRPRRRPRCNRSSATCGPTNSRTERSRSPIVRATSWRPRRTPAATASSRCTGTRAQELARRPRRHQPRAALRRDHQRLRRVRPVPALGRMGSLDLKSGSLKPARISEIHRRLADRNTALVAQWIEHLITDQAVGSSTLSGRTIETPAPSMSRGSLLLFPAPIGPARRPGKILDFLKMRPARCR